MDLTCKKCGKHMGVKEVVMQKLAVPTCIGASHAGPFEPVREGRTLIRPENVPVRTAVDA